MTGGTPTQKHNGCKGLENAFSKVSDKGNAKNALRQAAENIGGCDLPAE